MKITAGLMVKDGEYYLYEQLNLLSRVCNEIVILDDGSTDDTPLIYSLFPKVKKVERQENAPYHEGKNRNKVLSMIKETNPDWILFPDADEVIENRLVEKISELTNQEEIAGWLFHQYYFWVGKDLYREDFIGHNSTALRLYRNQPGINFRNVSLHCAVVQGLKGRTADSGLRIKHYSLLYKRERVRKHTFYNEIDVRNRQKNNFYRHLIDEDKPPILKKWEE